MTTRMLALLIALLLAPLAVTAAPPITLDSVLQELVEVESIARWPQAEFTCKQASSYDRGKVSPDKPGWFANHDHTQYIRTEDHEGRVEHVMMDADGPGVLVRFWLTAGVIGERIGVHHAGQHLPLPHQLVQVAPFLAGELAEPQQLADGRRIDVAGRRAA